MVRHRKQIPDRISMNDRSISSATRTVIYVLLMYWSLSDKGISSPLQSAALTGFVIADISTWFLWAFRDFFAHLSGNIWDTTINAIALFTIYQGPILQKPMDGDSSAICFIVMLATMAFKLAHFWIDVLMGDDEQ